jgi:hypothetical protein
MPDNEGVKRRQAQRLAVLKYMYDVAVDQENDTEKVVFDVEGLAEHLPLTPRDLESAISYLENEGFIEYAWTRTDTLGPTHFQLFSCYRISHQGIVEVEKVYLAPEAGTKAFPSQVVTLTINGDVGAVQTGPNATANVRQQKE